MVEADRGVCTLQQFRETKGERGKIGILGGTFNPVHRGHIAMAKRAAFLFSLNRVIFIPVGTPPHKRDEDVAHGEHRYAMLTLATQDEPQLEVSRMELDRSGYTYTIDTLKELRLLYPDESFCFIMGADTLFEVETWREYEQVMKLCSFAAFYRDGHDKDAIERQAQRLWLLYGAQIEIAEFFGYDISSTQIRAMVRAGESIHALVPMLVERYIYDNGVYV
ncbi:MAG: nicotinate-nucleotide adenylyltransferase [Christensenellales bacterium]|jgi:nicotinate-nucleotide adenylyltransferase